MILNSESVKPEHVEAYRRDGAVVVRSAFDVDTIEEMRSYAARILVDHEDFGLLPTYPGRYMSRLIEPFRRFVFESEVGVVSSDVLQSTTIRFLFDEIFAKGPKSTHETIWHNDRAGWPVTGAKIPSIWIPLSAVTKENCLECIAGSHNEDVVYWNSTPNSRKMVRPEGRPTYPDCEPLRNDPQVRFLTWDMEPGDALFVHPWTLHYSGGNSADDWRIALSIRVMGDDIMWSPRPECLNIAGISFDEMLLGEPPQGNLLPLLWSSEGVVDNGDLYPREFATRWSPRAMGDANDYAVFQRHKIGAAS